MTYEELQKQVKAIERKEKAFSRKCSKKELALKRQYINEHKTIELKRFQRIIVRLRITEKSRERMGEMQRSMSKNILGREYSLTGVFNGWFIADDGQLKPCFYGEPSYSAFDEVMSVELTKDQPQGHCSKCRCHKDGLCYMMGGKDLGKSCAVWKITDDMVPCPKYEEIVDSGLYEYGEKHCPNVTKCWQKGKLFYNVYSLNWDYYTEYSEDEVWRFFTKEPKKVLQNLNLYRRQHLG